MKKLILLVLLFIVMTGCDNQEFTNSYKVGPNVYYEIVIDGCEYIYHDRQLSHKGNCKFCAERRRKEQEELIHKIKEQ